MMKIDIITTLPGLLAGPFSESMLKRAQEKGLVEIEIHNLRAYSEDKHQRVDDYAFGGGSGMVMKIEPIAKCINTLKKKTVYDEIIYMSPDGKLLNQAMANTLSLSKNLILLCGHYKGVDERVREHIVTKEISIGDYVLTGGELAAAVLTDSIVRLIPGVLNDETSALTDSFQDDLISPPVYTRPAEYEGLKVPDILLSGHEKAIEDWRMEEAIKRTKVRRPGLLND